ncbi:nuclease domain-containing protein [Paenibacillus sp. MSJ-34]|uniref:5-methylcytosine restriction system specificity protein McrC n=1 Tax=Paenibacillus sp. MSJ-34 TaxID=2841529 RepID=UPI001C0FFC8F|nr:nuclease domain-containing protein [Paenibacillus sp. MSJ-34]MBU5444275.1 McrC family protein [Paenibacillus sp. MSJ-34]
MRSAQGRTEIIANDLSEIELINDDEKIWLQNLCRYLDKELFTIRLTDKSEDEPVIEFRHGRWYAGRYVGEIQYMGRTLRITPRYESSFHRWISTIWGVRMIQSKGSYRNANMWLWELIARIWGEQLIRGAKHGLPYTRMEETLKAPSLRGRMKVMETALEVGKGTNRLASLSRCKVIHPDIAYILSNGYRRIKKELGHRNAHNWLSDRGREIISLLLQSEGCKSYKTIYKIPKIKYTPILESYRPVVDLTLRILQQKSFGVSLKGAQEVTGTLLDMAEIWELYVYHLLRNALVGVEVIHTGRVREAVGHLFVNGNGKKIAAQKPDFIIRRPSSKQVLAVVDAKYKHTFVTLSKPTGLEQNDLYQIHAYMDAFSNQGSSAPGVLVYPDENDAEIRRYQQGNPWFSSQLKSNLYFYGVNGELGEENSDNGLTPSEERFCMGIRELLMGNLNNGIWDE